MQLIKRTQFFLLAVVASLSAGLAQAQTEDIKIKLEEPVADSVYANVGNLRGWAVAKAGVRRVELYIDGEYVSDIPSGGRREDVGAAFPNYPDSKDGGFSMAFNYKNLSRGIHTVTVRAVAEDNSIAEDSVNFETKRFNSEWIGQNGNVDLSTATLSFVNDKGIRMRGVQFEETFWDVYMRWDVESQQLVFDSIDKTDAPIIREALVGKWQVEGFKDQFEEIDVDFDAGNNRVELNFNYADSTKWFSVVTNKNTDSNVLTEWVISDNLVNRQDLSLDVKFIIHSADRITMEVENCYHPSGTDQYCTFKSGKTYTMRKVF